MANIKGYEVKALKNTIGSEGHGYYANLYYKNKKVGTVADYADGGPVNVNVESEHNEILEKVSKEYLTSIKSDFVTVDIFISELVELKENEGIFKKAIKKGYGSIVILQDDYKRRGPRKVPQLLQVPEGYDISTINEEGYDEVIQYSSLEDFNIV